MLHCCIVSRWLTEQKWTHVYVSREKIPTSVQKSCLLGAVSLLWALGFFLVLPSFTCMVGFRRKCTRGIFKISFFTRMSRNVTAHTPNRLDIKIVLKRQMPTVHLGQFKDSPDALYQYYPMMPHATTVWKALDELRLF
jgi:hypothetical protein